MTAKMVTGDVSGSRAPQKAVNDQWAEEEDLDEEREGSPKGRIQQEIARGRDGPATFRLLCIRRTHRKESRVMSMISCGGEKCSVHHEPRERAFELTSRLAPGTRWIQEGRGRGRKHQTSGSSKRFFPNLEVETEIKKSQSIGACEAWG